MARITGTVLCLDLGVNTGFAIGRPGDAPVSGTVVLKKPKEELDVALGNLLAFLNEKLTVERPEVVIREKIMSLEAFRAMNMGQDSVYAQAAYHGVVRAICARHGIPAQPITDSTFRKHFIGKGRMGSRNATKSATVARCHLLGLMPKDCFDDNRADALALHDWACSTFGGRSASHTNFALFGQERARHV